MIGVAPSVIIFEMVNTHYIMLAYQKRLTAHSWSHRRFKQYFLCREMSENFDVYASRSYHAFRHRQL